MHFSRMKDFLTFTQGYDDLNTDEQVMVLLFSNTSLKLCNNNHIDI